MERNRNTPSDRSGYGPAERYNVSLYSFSFIDRELIRHFVYSDLSNYQSNAGIVYELLLAKSGLHAISYLCVADMHFIIH